MSILKQTVSTEIIPYIFYRDVPIALDWLARAFGFTEEMRHATPGGMHAQMTLDGQRIMMGQGSKEWGMLSPHETKSATQGIFVYLDDVDAHYARPRPRSSTRHATNPTAAPTPHATSTAIPGSSRALPPSADRPGVGGVARR